MRGIFLNIWPILVNRFDKTPLFLYLCRIKMRKLLCILFLIIATVSYIAVTAIPHHHHGDKICMAIELCGEDGNVNDNHTHHHGDSNDKSNTDGYCPLNAKDIAATSKSLYKCSCDIHNPVFATVTTVVIFSFDNEIPVTYNPYVQPFYKSPQTYAVSSLRAPPQA